MSCWLRRCGWLRARRWGSTVSTLSCCGARDLFVRNQTHAVYRFMLSEKFRRHTFPEESPCPTSNAFACVCVCVFFVFGCACLTHGYLMLTSHSLCMSTFCLCGCLALEAFAPVPNQKELAHRFASTSSGSFAPLGIDTERRSSCCRSHVALAAQAFTRPSALAQPSWKTWLQR